MQLIKLNEQEYKIPTSVEELSKNQYLTAAEILIGYHENSADLIKIELAKVVLPFENSFYDLWKQDCINAYGEKVGATVFYDELKSVTDEVTFFFFDRSEEDSNQLTLNTKFIKNYFPEIKFKKGNKQYKYFGPKDGLRNITIYELAKLFTEYDQYLQDDSQSHLDEIIAVMYRPAKTATKHNIMSGYEGDKRLPYRKYESTIRSRKEIFKDLDPRVKEQIIFYFSNSRNEIIKMFPVLFSGDGKKSSASWVETIYELAGEFSNVEKVEDQQALFALHYLQTMQLKAE